jgi:alpha-ketoglutarate-dependent taurine dioxygenase
MIVTPVDATLGAIVTEVALADLDDATWSEIESAFHEHALLIFPCQHLDPAAHRSFGTRFGRIEMMGDGDVEMAAYSLGNLKADGTQLVDRHDPRTAGLRGNERWHTDSSFKPVSAKASILSARTVPTSGGQTEWADMRAAYDALSPEMRAQVETMEARHSYRYSQGKLGHDVVESPYYSDNGGKDPLRPLVKIHPETGRPSLFIGRHAFGIPSMSEEESEQFLSALIDWACQPPRVYSHTWEAGDLVVWDNRCVLHRARPYDLSEVRTMMHTRVAGEPETEGAPLVS